MCFLEDLIAQYEIELYLEMEVNRDKLLPFTAQMSIVRVLRQISAQQAIPDIVGIWTGPGSALAEDRSATEPER